MSKEHPISFNSEMVRAILEGRKTQTRRIIKPQPYQISGSDAIASWVWGKNRTYVGSPLFLAEAPYQAGDRLWVRESATVIKVFSGEIHIRYEADKVEAIVEFPSRLKPVIVGQKLANGCYKEAARLWPEVVEVKAQMLQDISEDDAIAEGVQSHCCGYKNYMWPKVKQGSKFPDNARESFRSLWQSIYGVESLEKDWVWVYEFKVGKQ